MSGKKRKKHPKRTKRTKRTKHTKRTKRTKHTKRTKKLYNKKYCSPRNKKDSYKFTCYTRKSLEKLKKIWNMRHPSSKINTNHPKKIWKELSQHMKNTCEKEHCWLEHQCIKNDINKKLFDDNFLTKAPNSWKDDPKTWLNTLDIQNVMAQYENKYPNFRFLGASPIDYDTKIYNNDCVWDDLCKFNLKNELDNNITKIGVVFNLDKHDKPGSHWVAVYIDTKKKEIYFFCSYGSNPNRQTNKFCKNVQKQAKKLNEDYIIKINKTAHQTGEGECGLYCIYLIINLLKGKSFDKFNETRINQKYMNKRRKKFFIL